MTHRRGFSLIELLVVISIVAALSALLIPALSMVKTAAHKARCLSALRQLSVAGMEYTNDNQGLLPRYSMTGAKWPDLIIGYLEAGSSNNNYVLTDPNLILRKAGCPAREGSICDTNWSRQGLDPKRYSSYGYMKWANGRIVGSPEDLSAFDVSISSVTFRSRRAWFFDADRLDENLHCPAAGWAAITVIPGIFHNRHRDSNGYAFMDGHAQVLLPTAGIYAWTGKNLDKAPY